jgi:hypothetical protein
MMFTQLHELLSPEAALVPAFGPRMGARGNLAKPVRASALRRRGDGGDHYGGADHGGVVGPGSRQSRCTESIFGLPPWVTIFLRRHPASPPVEGANSEAGAFDVREIRDEDHFAVR